MASLTLEKTYLLLKIVLVLDQSCLLLKIVCLFVVWFLRRHVCFFRQFVCLEPLDIVTS